MVCLPLAELSKTINKHLVSHPNASVGWNDKLVDLGQDDAGAWVKIETPGGIKTTKADYIIGCDGANSKTRRFLFSDRAFPGET